jgi:nitric oxide reductase NorE protein
MSSVQTRRGPEKHVPGEVGIWIFILGDMMVFALFFCVFVYYRSLNIELYTQSQTALKQIFGVVNTVLLLSSSLFVVLAVQAVRRRIAGIAPVLFALAFLCGLGFGTMKFIEYGQKISAGITLTTNEFFMYFYVFTGIHFLHVVIGMVVLGFLWKISRKPDVQAKDLMLIESGASYWHMVDLLWIVLFPLLYLMK